MNAAGSPPAGEFLKRLNAQEKLIWQSVEQFVPVMCL
jgi:hypothetical protein